MKSRFLLLSVSVATGLSLGRTKPPRLPCLALPCLALPCPVAFYFSVSVSQVCYKPCLALPCLALPCLALPCLALPCLALPCKLLCLFSNLVAPSYSVKSVCSLTLSVGAVAFSCLPSPANHNLNSPLPDSGRGEFQVVICWGRFTVEVCCWCGAFLAQWQLCFQVYLRFPRS